MKCIEYQKKDNIAYITLNRPDKLNAINVEMSGELCAAWEDFKQDDSLFVAVLSANGRSFCSGMDVDSMKVKNFEVDHCTPSYMQVWKPVIAAVHGHVLGAGIFLALSCDLRIAAEDAGFGLPEVKLNIPMVRALRLPYYIPRGIVYELAYTANRIDARRAYEIGLVNRVVSGDQLLPEATKLAQSITRNGPLAIKAQKMVFETTKDMSLSDAEKLARQVYAPVKESEDSKEALAAFKEKRSLVWKNR
jgi:enoyl-CoA hydratase/carnithine racemase